MSAYTLPLSHCPRPSRTETRRSESFSLPQSPPPTPQPDSGLTSRALPSGRQSGRFSLPQRGVHPRGAPVLSEPLDVPVFLAQDGDLVLEEDGVQPHLGVDQRHGAKPAGELVHAGLPLGKVVGVGPARGPGRLEEGERERESSGKTPSGTKMIPTFGEELKDFFTFTSQTRHAQDDSTCLYSLKLNELVT